MPGEFRFTYFTPDYDETVAFYRDGLGFPIVRTWDRSADDGARCSARRRG